MLDIGKYVPCSYHEAISEQNLEYNETCFLDLFALLLGIHKYKHNFQKENESK